ncbi:hypothetical protein CRENBAI_013981 [Crenichthys baileyi]|uniref:Uncharacterized protein n=1 Tax=Crenichthys baileyi TaxID=28760 RepID=A0AAV9RFE3_9TELE
MIPPTYGPRGQKGKGRRLGSLGGRQKAGAMRNLPTDLEVLPSPLLLEQMEREAAQRQRVREGCFFPPPLSSDVPPLLLPYRQLSRHLPPVTGETLTCRGLNSRSGVGKGAPLLREASPHLPATQKFPRVAQLPPLGPLSAPGFPMAPPKRSWGSVKKVFFSPIKVFKRTFPCFSPVPGADGKGSGSGEGQKGVSKAVFPRSTFPPGLSRGCPPAAAEEPTPGLRGLLLRVKSPPRQVPVRV